MATRVIAYGGNEYTLAYEIVHPASSRDCVVLHGWGASKELMRGAFGGCLASWRHIYIDLPGFGASSASVALHTDDYAAILALFFESLGIKPELIIGHSFGGKVATLLAPKQLVLIATSGIVVEKPLRVRLKIALFKRLKSLGLGGLRRIFAADDGKHLSETMYQTFKNVVDEDFSPQFATCKSRTLILWGIEDRATPISCAHEIHHLISGSQLFECSGDHYFFLEKKMLTCKAIEDFIGEGA
ncbi:MAG: alpha/beta hydrolase [Campylobacterales bacterium]|nr:alpha/beta hydrolase [Campylobacterales bacterium]